ncbi:MAG: 16S rRNA (adenine(1518)-N(6)/adenine(1519)-N(6))-dimethyltransferase [Legionellales bacterium RIFCSPHIGHO2_12_FULL_35_11]|nr:MAG: 16S rRNA (adenine(1518)-N(6)/adenine(1519)-N(6))-dimethyltransferase [Legionellales bacterium RIFCSPHIGHO2_12_FULL_35_11]
MSHRPRKRFGQNFLQDERVINTIVKAMALKKTDNVVEIGPGLGAITKPILKILESLKVIEIDNDLVALLKENSEFNNLIIINQDVLQVDFSNLGENLRVIGNLPYNISTPLLIKLLGFTDKIKDMHFMIQKEVADRIAASPGCKTYGRLTVMIQCFYDVENIIDVEPHAFYPAPKVQSTVIRLTPHKIPLINKNSFSNLENLIRQAFAMRRKTIANNLKSIISAADLQTLNIDPTTRPEQISINDYLKIEKFISK